MKALLPLAAIWGGFFFAMSASAESLCGLRAEIVASLHADFAEAQVGRGLTASGRLVELFVSPRGTFTILVSTPTGQSCVAAVGRDWDIAAGRALPLPLSPDRVH